MLELLGFYRRTGFCRFLFHRRPITPSGQGRVFAECAVGYAGIYHLFLPSSMRLAGDAGSATLVSRRFPPPSFLLFFLASCN